MFASVAQGIAATPVPARIAACCAVALAFRVVVYLSGWFPIGDRAIATTEPRLAALAALLAAAGCVAGFLLAGRGTAEVQVSDRAAAAVAGSCFAILFAAVLHAFVRAVERPLGDWAGSAWAVALLWIALGAALAGLSGVFIPVRHTMKEVSR